MKSGLPALTARVKCLAAVLGLCAVVGVAGCTSALSDDMHSPGAPKDRGGVIVPVDVQAQAGEPRVNPPEPSGIGSVAQDTLPANPSADSVSPSALSERAPSPLEQGRASWYGRKFHGRTTASGEPFDMNALSAAHRTLPFGSQVCVTNLRNRKTVRVRINDRGPFHGKRIIDLSKAAARAIGLRGTGMVRLDVGCENSMSVGALTPAALHTAAVRHRYRWC